MAFDPRCTRALDKRPTVYLVDAFLRDESTGRAGRFSDYQDEVQKSFQKTWDASFNQLVMRTSQDPPGSKGTPLFIQKPTKSFDEIPKVLGWGDIIIGFDQTPPYSLSPGQEIMWPPSSDEEHIALSLFKPFEKEFRTRFEEKIENVLREPKASVPQNIGDIGGVGRCYHRENSVQLKSGGMKDIFVSIAIGVVNIALPAREAALHVWKYSTKIKNHPQLGILQTGDFSAAAVKKLAEGERAKGPSFLEAVGRGLAYTCLHEFWHCAEQSTNSDAHPYGTGNNLIEGGARAGDTAPSGGPLTLNPTAITNILGRYERGWCVSLTKGRVSVAEL